jgi:hypothetical protein
VQSLASTVMVGLADKSLLVKAHGVALSGGAQSYSSLRLESQTWDSTGFGSWNLAILSKTHINKYDVRCR